MAKRRKKFRIFPRYRKPSVGEIIGTTQLKRKVSRKIGLAKMRHPVKTRVTNAKRRAKYRVGYYSEPVKALRHLGKSCGCCSLVILLPVLIVLAVAVFLVLW